MDSQNQFYIFWLCVAVGFCGGLLYEFFAFIRMLFRQGKGERIAAFLCDAAFFIAFAAFAVFAAVVLRFPTFRVYMWLGYALGGIIYLKTLRRIVAFLENVCYNVVRQKAKSKKKLFEKGDEII